VLSPLEERPNVGRRDGRWRIRDGMRGQEIGVDDLLAVGLLDAAEWAQSAHEITPRRGTAAARDGVEGDLELEDAFGVFAGAVPPGRGEALGKVAR